MPNNDEKPMKKALSLRGRMLPPASGANIAYQNCCALCTWSRSPSQAKSSAWNHARSVYLYRIVQKSIPLIAAIQMPRAYPFVDRSEEHTSELQSPCNLV